MSMEKDGEHKLGRPCEITNGRAEVDQHGHLISAAAKKEWDIRGEQPLHLKNAAEHIKKKLEEL